MVKSAANRAVLSEFTEDSVICSHTIAFLTHQFLKLPLSLVLWVTPSKVDAHWLN